MGWKDKLRVKAYEASLAATGMTPIELKQILKERSKEKLTTFGTNFFPFLLKLFVISLIVFQAFYPEMISGIFLILIVAIVILAILSLLFGGFTPLVLGRSIAPLIVLFIVAFFVWTLPSPNYSKWLGVRFGPIASGLIFLFVFGVSLLLLATGTIGFIIGSIVWILVLFFYETQIFFNIFI